MSDSPSKKSSAADSYADLFPELNSMLIGGGNKVPSLVGSGTAVGAVRPSTTTTVFRIGAEEQRLLAGTKYGDDVKQRRIIEQVSADTGVQIDMSYTKDSTLCVVLNGKASAVEAAKDSLIKRLQKQAEIELTGIPSEHFKAIIGRGGETLKGIQTETSTNVKIPRDDDISGVIRISGPIDGCNKARAMIQYLSDLEANRDRVKLNVLKAYHPLLAGHKHETIKRISKATGASIHVPPASKDVDEIVVSGEKEGVQAAAAELAALYETLKQTCGELSANIKKSQHRYIIGRGGQYLDEIMRDFGVIVEIPPSEEESDSIMLRGPQTNLVNALTKVFERAASMTSDELAVPGWLHRHIIGRKGATLAELTKPFPGSTVDFIEESALVKLEGPPAEVQGLKTLLGAKRDELIATIATRDLKIDPEFHSRIIGKGGATVSKIKEATGAQINFPRPDADENKDVIRVDGPKEGVKEACAQIEEVVRKFKDYTEIKYEVEQRLHSLIIGAKGAQIKKIIADCGDITLDVPKNTTESNEVSISGDKAAVAKAKVYLDKFVKQLREENFELEVAVFKPYHGTIIGKAGSTINKVKQSTGTRIDIPSAKDPSDVIVITGIKAKCEEARKQILAIQDGIAKIVSETLEFSDKLSSKLATVVFPTVQQSSGGILIAPSKGGLQLQGPEESIEVARDRLLAIANKYAEGKTIECLDVPRKHFRQLSQGNFAEKVEGSTGAFVFIPPTTIKGDDAVITLLGSKEECGAARESIEKRVAEIEDTVKETVEMPKKYHKELLARRSKFLTDLRERTGVAVQIPKDDTEVLKLEGSRTRMAEAVEALKAFPAQVDARVTIEVDIPARDHRVFFTNGGAEIRRITDEQDVSIKIPDRNKGSRENIITIGGLPDSCKAAEAALRVLLPIEETIEIDSALHRFIIGKGGEAVRKFMNDFNVSVNFPKNEASTVRVRGEKTKVANAIDALKLRVVELAELKADIDARSFKMELDIDPRFHVRLIGKQGSNINRLREEHNVEINFPDRRAKKSASAADMKKITVVGYEAAVKKACDDIMKMVEELQSLVNISIDVHPGCHRRIIGARGATIKALQSKYKVRVFMPREDGGPVRIEGPEETALDCKDEILDIEEEWKQDQDEVEEESMYVLPSRSEESSKKKRGGKGDNAFVVKDAPWEKPPDTDDAASFPGLGGSSTYSASVNSTVWGPR